MEPMSINPEQQHILEVIAMGDELVVFKRSRELGATCANCFGEAPREAALCEGCERKYQEFLAAYRPRRVKYSDGRRGTSAPQTRHQWAAHQRRKR